ncbi:MAG: iron-sulfur cluster assembly accessory protein [Nitrospirae bacterium]|nr:iron-sulfur cluster assembly accessory protein [Nitrospirota bacterium]
MADVHTSPISLTEAAIKKVKVLLTAQPEGSFLRVSVRGGGCSGLSYELAFEPKQGPHDEVAEFDGVKVLIDPKSALYLQGTSLDFVDSLTGGGFKFNNPNAKMSCGCGESFSA